MSDGFGYYQIDQGARIGLELAEALLEQVRDICQGTYLVPSFGRYEDMCDRSSPSK